MELGLLWSAAYLPASSLAALAGALAVPLGKVVAYSVAVAAPSTDPDQLDSIVVSLYGDRVFEAVSEAVALINPEIRASAAGLEAVIQLCVL